MFIKLYFIALTVFFSIDLVWLSLIAKNFYNKHLGYLMKTQVNFIPALIFYLLFTLGLVLFVITPSLEKNSIAHAVLFGALFGLITYATYDLTNHATIKDWPLIVTIIDLIWGSSLALLVSAITHLIAKKLGL